MDTDRAGSCKMH